MTSHSMGLPIPFERVAAFVRNGGDNGWGGPSISRKAMYRHLVENNTLREDQTRAIEEALLGVARRDLVGMADISGFRVPLAQGIGATTFEYDKIAPVGEATQSMSILNLGARDLVNFSRTAIPVPVTASQFRMDARLMAAGRGMGQSVDVTNIEEHSRSVMEKLEDTLVNGSTVVLGTNTLTGYTNFACRESLSFSGGTWSLLTPPGLGAAVTDVLAMRAALRDNGYTGPYTLYLPTNFDGVIDDDYKTESDRTLRERLLVINGISQIKVLPQLSDSEVLLVQMTRSVVELAVGQSPTVVTWDEFGGLAMNWAIVAVMAPALKCANARAPLASGTLPALTTTSGIAHLT